jgi:hypothetical protein
MDALEDVVEPFNIEHIMAVDALKRLFTLTGRVCVKQY